MFALAYWLDVEAATLEGQPREELARRRDETARHPFREPTFGYLFAVLAALVAWGLRIVIDPYLPGSVPFVTYFIAVAASGWVGGYGPAVLTTALWEATKIGFVPEKISTGTSDLTDAK